MNGIGRAALKKLAEQYQKFDSEPGVPSVAKEGFLESKSNHSPTEKNSDIPALSSIPRDSATTMSHMKKGTSQKPVGLPLDSKALLLPRKDSNVMFTLTEGHVDQILYDMGVLKPSWKDLLDNIPEDAENLECCLAHLLDLGQEIPSEPLLTVINRLIAEVRGHLALAWQKMPSDDMAARKKETHPVFWPETDFHSITAYQNSQDNESSVVYRKNSILRRASSFFGVLPGGLQDNKYPLNIPEGEESSQA